MATDHYGNTIDVGDRVSKVGYCDEFIISDITYGGEMVNLTGYGRNEQNVNSNDVIKQ